MSTTGDGLPLASAMTALDRRRPWVSALARAAAVVVVPAIILLVRAPELISVLVVAVGLAIATAALFVFGRTRTRPGDVGDRSH